MVTEEAWTRMPSDSIKPGYPASNTVSGLLVAYMRHFSASIWGPRHLQTIGIAADELDTATVGNAQTRRGVF